jgi:mannosyltransferase
VLEIEAGPEVRVVSEADPRSRGWGWLVAGVSACSALAAGGYRIGYTPLWRDEAATKEIAGRSVSRLLATLPHNDAVHGAYYLVIHVVMRLLGTSAAALRLPSLIAMAVTSAVVALIARDLAREAGAPFAGLTGLAAGVVFSINPFTIAYAQTARSYAIVTMLATIATYLLLKAVRGESRAWPAYGAVVALTGLFNLFGLLIVVAHGLSLLAVGRRPKGIALWSRWLFAVVIAGLISVPVLLPAYAQRGQLSWMSAIPPWWPDFMVFIHCATGNAELTVPIVALAIVGIVAETVAAGGRLTLGPSIIAVPWLLGPPLLLLTVSQIRCVWNGRYVEFCLPASAILIAWGLNWLARALAATPLLRLHLAWLPILAVPVVLFAALGPTAAAFRDSRPDNLLGESGIIARNARPGDIIFYLPLNERIVSTPYPGPFRELRDIALALSPVASNTLYGTDVSAAELEKRFVRVTRVWVVASSEVDYLKTSGITPDDAEEGRMLSGMRAVHQWRDGDTMLVLYTKVRRPHGHHSRVLRHR